MSLYAAFRRCVRNVTALNRTAADGSYAALQ